MIAPNKQPVDLIHRLLLVYELSLSSFSGLLFASPTVKPLFGVEDIIPYKKVDCD